MVAVTITAPVLPRRTMIDAHLEIYNAEKRNGSMMEGLEGV